MTHTRESPQSNAGANTAGDSCAGRPATSPSSLKFDGSALPLILDGAMGTELARRGVVTSTPLWSAAALETSTETIQQIHAEYVAAGADVIMANTFRANPRALQRGGHADDGAMWCRRAVALARAAAGPGTLIAASVGPVEDCYTPALTPRDDELRDEHNQLAEWLASAEPDLLWIETMGTAREARAAASAAARVGLSCTVSFVTREDGALLSGDSLASAVAAIAEFAPLAIGLNCIPPAGLSITLPALRRLTERPLAAYAHIGDARPLPGWSYAQAEVSPEEYADFADTWRCQGASIVGGCCGTTPTHIRAIARRCRAG